jgi:peptide/nickel transport system substrate-binding protein
VDPVTWVVSLRNGVKFQNGDPFDARSVEFSLNRLIGAGANLRGAATFEPIERVEVLDPHTVRIKTRRPWPLLPAALTLSQAAMYPPAYKTMTPEGVARQPIGTGPFRLVQWDRGEKILLEARPDPWRGKPRFASVTFVPISDDSARVAALQEGRIDLAISIPPALGSSIERDPKLVLRTTPKARTVQLMFYTHRVDSQGKALGAYPGPTADRRVRHAIALAIDVDEVIKTELRGHATRLATMLATMYVGFDPQRRPIGPDPSRSKKLLAEAGYPNGLDLALNTPAYLSPVAAALAAQLRKSDIRLSVQALDTAVYYAKVARREAGPIALMWWQAPLLDAQQVYGPLFRSGGPYANWHDDRFDALVDQAAITMEAAKRASLYREITGRWLEELPAVPLYQESWIYGMRKDLRISFRVDGDVGATKCDCPNDKTCCPTSDDCAEYRKKDRCP